MSKNYVQYMQSITTAKTLNRKNNYIKYNFGKILKKVSLNSSSNLKILEIGPGLGEFISYCSNNYKKSVIDIVDNDQSILFYNKEKYSIRKTFLIDKDVKEISNKLDDYDIIVATQVLEHIPVSQQISFISTLFKHLKKNGTLIVTAPNMANPFTLCERYADITHTTGFTDNAMKELFLKSINSSNVAIKIQPFRIPPYSIANILRIIAQKILHYILITLSIINAGSYSTILTPNITLVIYKK